MAKSSGGLTQWFKENWVDLSRPKKGGGYEPCGRGDASKGKYPKCVPASRAASMSQKQISSAVSRKRRAESSSARKDKKPINVSTDVKKKGKGGPCWDGYRQDGMKKGKNGNSVPNCVPISSTKVKKEKATMTEEIKKSKNVPTNAKLYARVKAAAKAKFDVYPSAYANGWLVAEYKRRGGKYKTVSRG